MKKYDRFSPISSYFFLRNNFFLFKRLKKTSENAEKLRKIYSTEYTLPYKSLVPSNLRSFNYAETYAEFPSFANIYNKIIVIKIRKSAKIYLSPRFSLMIVEYKENVEYEKIGESKSSIGFRISVVKFRDI